MDFRQVEKYASQLLVLRACLLQLLHSVALIMIPCIAVPANRLLKSLLEIDRSCIYMTISTISSNAHQMYFACFKLMRLLCDCDWERVFLSFLFKFEKMCGVGCD